jgi:succinate dehydrogenase/fumarate reductase-like Fe-S protein
MSETQGKGEMHGCIVCGRLYQVIAAYDSNGKYIGSKIMSAGAKEVTGMGRPLVACERHSNEEIARAVERVYGKRTEEDEL